MNKQSQKSGDDSTNVQANEIIINQGLTLSEARDVALDVFKANFYELSGNAKKIAEERAEEVTEKFLRKLQNENPDGFKKSEDPDFQHSLFTVQKEYARNGDSDLGELLVDLLVDRSKQDKRNILQIVLNESLNTAPKLTSEQLAALAVIFLFRYTQNYNVGNHELLGQYLDKHAIPFIEQISKSDSCYQHLEFAGCGSVSMGSISLESILSNTYHGMFLKGIDKKVIEDEKISVGLDPNYFMTCLNDPDKIQVRSVNKEMLKKHLDGSLLQEFEKDKITSLFDVGKMNEEEIRKKCIEIRPKMEKLFDTWKESKMASFNLTSVGIAIGHANIKRLVGEFADLTIWIN